MPIELTPGPSSHLGLLDLSGPYLHPNCYPGGGPGSSMYMPASGPARAIDCIQRPGPNQCLPNGLKNPWAPYAGETYTPSSQTVIDREIATGIAGRGGQSQYAGPARYGGGCGSVIAPIGLGSVYGGSVIYPSQAPPGGPGGIRDDDGWYGSMGRRHNDIAPDISSQPGYGPRITTGDIGGIGSTSNWLHSPSSPANHVRLTPSLAGPGDYLRPHTHAGYVQPPMAPPSISYSSPQSHRPRRIPPVGTHVNNELLHPEHCPECCHRAHVHAHEAGVRRSRSMSSAEREHGQSHYRHVSASRSPAVGSPLRGSAEAPLRRKVSNATSRRSSVSSSKYCSECAS